MNHEQIRSLAQASGAIMAIFFAPIGLYLTWKRTVQLSRQNDLTVSAQTYLADSDEKKRLHENYQLGIQELAHDHEFRRLGAVVILGDVGKDFNFLKPAYSAISGMIRSISVGYRTDVISEADEITYKSSQPSDLLAAIEQIKNRKVPTKSNSIEKYELNLQNAYLPFSDLSQADLRHSNLNHIVLFGSQCVMGRFKKASLINANLSNVNFKKADFSSADLTGTKFNNANLRKTKFLNAIISGSDFSGAKFPEITVIKSRVKKDPEQLLKWLNYTLPNPINYGDKYHPLQTATWDPKKPPIVDPDLALFVHEKTKFIMENESDSL